MQKNKKQQQNGLTHCKFKGLIEVFSYYNIILNLYNSYRKNKNKIEVALK